MLKKLIFCLFLVPTSILAQQTITAAFEPSEDFSYIILYQVEPTKNMYVADSRKDANGKFEFTLDADQPAGIYKVVYGIPQQEKSFDIIYSGNEAIDFTFSITDGIKFHASEENSLLVSYEAEMGALQRALITEYQAETPDENKIVSLFAKMKSLQSTFEEQAEGKIAQHFIKANTSYTPNSYQDFNMYVNNRKQHHFDAIDFTNPILQKSSFLQETSVGYITGFINPQMPNESYKHNIDTVASQLNHTDPDYQKAFLHGVWNQLRGYNLNEASIYLADTYLLPIAKKTKDTGMVNDVFKARNLTIGATAPNFSWNEDNNENGSKKWLSDLPQADQYFLVFWSSGCSHCLQEIPLVYNATKDLPVERLHVVAIGLEDGPENWKNTITQFPSFTHVLGLGKWENEIGNTYNITGTPTYFVLDSEKRIKAKPETLDELLQYVIVNK